MYVAAALLAVLQYIGWHRVGDLFAVGTRAVAGVIAPAITLGWPFLLAFTASIIARRRAAGRVRERLSRPGESWVLGLTLTAFLALGLLLACVLIFPRLLYPPLTDREVKQAGVADKDALQLQSDRLKLENEARTTLLQGLGGAAVLLGVYFTFRQLRIARQGQVTDRFTRAVDQLGSKSEDVQLGGIYALQQISRDSHEERSAIHEILAAYVRNHSPWDRHDTRDVDVATIPRLRERAPGVQAAMLALGRRDRPTGSPLGLMGTNLQRLRLSDTDIPGGANLAKALFWRSSLINASLGHANLRGAKLGWTDLRHSPLTDTDLRDADLRGADLRHADLRRADLRGANLRDTENLETANLEGARAGAKAKDETKWPDNFDWRRAGVVMDP
jgi:hypothetical protein